MYCPETYKFHKWGVWLCHYGRGDVRWYRRPRSERWNPLRYEIGFRRKGVSYRFNKSGRAGAKFSNLIFRLRKILKRTDDNG